MLYIPLDVTLHVPLILWLLYSGIKIKQPRMMRCCGRFPSKIKNELLVEHGRYLGYLSQDADLQRRSHDDEH
jgi:hypothetical protein